MTTKRGYAWWVAGLATLVGGQFADAQVTSQWSVANATPQQTAFANITFGGPPEGIWWADTNSVDPLNAKWLKAPVLSDGLLIFTLGHLSLWSTRIFDAESGQCLYTFLDTNVSLLAIGKIGTQTTLFRAVPVYDYTQHTTVVTLTAYDLGRILARTPGAEPVPMWSSQFTLSAAVIPFLNYMEGALYLANLGGIIKIDGTSGTQMWANGVPADGNLAVGDVWVPSGAGPQLKRLVFAADWNNGVCAVYDGDGSIAWQTAANRAEFVTLVKVPAPAGPLDAWRVLVSCETASLLCLNASDGSVEPNWPQPLKANCLAANGPVAVRYVYDASGNVTDATIFITPGSDDPSDSEHPLFAFDLNGSNAWPAPLLNPIQLPSAAGWTEPAVTQDRVFLVLQDGSLFSLDLNSGKTSVNRFGLHWGYNLSPVVADSGHGPLLYAYSPSLGYLALAPNDRFQPPVPRLTISLTATNTMLISWPSPFTGCILERNSSLGTTNWVDVAQTPVDNGTNKSVVIDRSSGTVFYRLRK